LLLRMHLDGQVVTPNRFLPHAESTELITRIDAWAVREGIRLGSRSPVAINLSAKSLSNARLLEWVKSGLAEFATDPGNVIFEITETAAAENLEAASTLVHGLSSLGCSVALDDFGTGYGSFTYLKYLPVSQLKVDITFIRNLIKDQVDRRVVTSIVAVADTFGMQTVAEGVEDAETLDALIEIGIDLAQGYYLGRPRPMEESKNADEGLAVASEG
jgi:EAL domain-containing protein (putative c-di-GMP-specific phosphodiesterase class I)